MAIGAAARGTWERDLESEGGFTVRSRTSRSLVAAPLLTALFAALSAAVPAVSLGALDVVHQPDGRIRGGYTSVWKGNDIYNLTGLHQKAVGGTYLPPAGEVHKFRISIQNDGTVAERIWVKAAGSGQGWKVQYFDGTTNITLDVLAGTFRTSSLAPGGDYLITAKLTTRANPLKIVRVVTLTSGHESAKRDAVKFVMQVTNDGCPPPGC